MFKCSTLFPVPEVTSSNGLGHVTIVLLATNLDVSEQFSATGWTNSSKSVWINNFTTFFGNEAAAPMLKPATESMNKLRQSYTKNNSGWLSVMFCTTSGNSPRPRRKKATVMANSNIHIKIHHAIENCTAVTMYHKASEASPAKGLSVSLLIKSMLWNWPPAKQEKEIRDKKHFVAANTVFIFQLCQMLLGRAGAVEVASVWATIAAAWPLVISLSLVSTSSLSPSSPSLCIPGGTPPSSSLSSSIMSTFTSSKSLPLVDSSFFSVFVVVGAVPV